MYWLFYWPCLWRKSMQACSQGDWDDHEEIPALWLPGLGNALTRGSGEWRDQKSSAETCPHYHAIHSAGVNKIVSYFHLTVLHGTYYIHVYNNVWTVT